MPTSTTSSGIEHQPSPQVIRRPARALRSGKWFARKFDDEDVLDQIDAALREGNPGGAGTCAVLGAAEAR